MSFQEIQGDLFSGEKSLTINCRGLEKDGQRQLANGWTKFGGVLKDAVCI